MFSHSSWSSPVWQYTTFYHVDSLSSQDIQGLRNLPYGVIGESSVGRSKVKLQAQQSHKKGWRAARQLEQLSWKMWNAEIRAGFLFVCHEDTWGEVGWDQRLSAGLLLAFLEDIYWLCGWEEALKMHQISLPWAKAQQWHTLQWHPWLDLSLPWSMWQPEVSCFSP